MSIETQAVLALVFARLTLTYVPELAAGLLLRATDRRPETVP